jgi:uncharacterized membrane protein
MVEAPRRTRALLLLAGMIWGTSFVAGKLGVEGTDPYLFSAMRSLVSAISILPVLLLYKFDYSIFRSKAVWGIAFLNAAGLLLQNVGLTYTTASNTVLLVDINVVIVAVLAATIILKESPEPPDGGGLVLGMSGVVLIATKGDISNPGRGKHHSGDMLVFTAGVAWAMYIVFTTKESQRAMSWVHFTSRDDPADRRVRGAHRAVHGRGPLGRRGRHIPGAVLGIVLHHGGLHALQRRPEVPGGDDHLDNTAGGDGLRAVLLLPAARREA